jgi:hypothetical protein
MEHVERVCFRHRFSPFVDARNHKIVFLAHNPAYKYSRPHVNDLLVRLSSPLVKSPLDHLLPALFTANSLAINPSILLHRGFSRLVTFHMSCRQTNGVCNVSLFEKYTPLAHAFRKSQSPKRTHGRDGQHFESENHMQLSNENEMIFFPSSSSPSFQNHPRSIDRVPVIHVSPIQSPKLLVKSFLLPSPKSPPKLHLPSLVVPLQSPT